MFRRIFYSLAFTLPLLALLACGGLSPQKPKRQARPARSTVATTPATPVPQPVVIPSEAPESETPSTLPLVEPSSEPPTEIHKWHGVDETLELGGCQVKIVSATIGRVPLEFIIGDDASESSEAHLLITVEIANITDRKKIDFRSWSGQFSSLMDIDADLADDSENSYRQVNFGASTTIRGSVEDESIYPKKSVLAAIPFEVPVDGFKFLRLTLSAKAIGAEGEFRFEIPAEFVTRS